MGQNASRRKCRNWCCPRPEHVQKRSPRHKCADAIVYKTFPIKHQITHTEASLLTRTHRAPFDVQRGEQKVLAKLGYENHPNRV